MINHRDNIKQLVASTAKPVSLLIADSNYGLNLGPGDVEWTSEFKNTLSLTPDSVILVEKDDTQHEGAVARIKEWLALSKDEADALEDRKLGTFPRKASGDAGNGEEEEEEAKYDEPLMQGLCSLAQLGKNIAAGGGDATEENEQAKANEDVGNPVGDDDDEGEREKGEGEEEEEDIGADNTSSEEDEYDDDEEESDEE
eukprot:jgi/Tetstr1/445644/TSEL_003449.t1